MLINVNPTTGEVTRIDGQEQDSALKICDRLKEELEGWLSYHTMSKNGDQRYEAISAQEFQHALVALSDLLNDLQGRLTPGEMEQFLKFKSECLAK